MAFCQLQWFSKVLIKQTTTWILLPEGGKPPFATFYLLHGLSDDHTIWMRRTSIERYVAGLPLIVVMPDGGRGWYTNHVSGPAYATHLAEELPEMIEATFPAKTTRASRCIGGLSMGGYGALRLALGYPDRYISATSHSGAVRGPSSLRRAAPDPEWAPIFGNRYDGTPNDLVKLAKSAKAKDMLPKLRLDCGTEDFLLDDNRHFHASLQRAKVEHEYEEFSGAHEWSYWDLHVREAIEFHCRALKLKTG